MEDRLKCRFCSWSIRRWITLKSGTPRHGLNKLIAHVEHKHPKEHQAITDWCNLIKEKENGT